MAGMLCHAEDAQVLDRGKWRGQTVQTIGELDCSLLADERKMSKYGGDGSDFCKGVVDRQYSPHTDMLELMGELNQHVYSSRMWAQR